MPCEITPDVLDEVRILAEQVGVGTEGLNLLLAQFEVPNDADNSLVLLGSAGEGALELLLTKWLGQECAEALRLAGTTPLILGPAPDSIPGNSSLIRWPSITTGTLSQHNVLGHIVAMQSASPISGKLEGQLTAFGCWDSAVVVSRASQPLPLREREFLRSLSNVIPAVAVLLIAIPGELQGPQDTTKVMEYVRGLVEDHGFPGTRFAGAWLWWIDGDLHNSDSAIRNPGELISRRDISNDQARDSLIRSSVVRLLHKIKQKAESIGVKPLPQLSDEELRTLDADLLIRLERVKTLADERFRDAPSLTDNEARSFVKNEILGWESSKNLYAGSWLRYVETVRPGTITGLFQHLETVLSTLTVRPSTTQSSESVHTTSSLSRLRHYLILHLAGEKAIHVSFSLLVGVALWYLTLAQAYSGAFPALAAAGGALAAFIFGKPVTAFILKAIGSTYVQRAPAVGAKWVSPSNERIENFNIFAQRLRDWFRQHVHADKCQVASRCDALLRSMS